MTTKRQVRLHTKNMHGGAVQSKTVTVHVTKDDIMNAECKKPTKCMIKVATKRALNLAHGYIAVDATGISITRNGLYREKSFMPRAALMRMLAFDREEEVKPFSFKLTFFKTSKIRKYNDEAREKNRITHIKSGSSKKKYNMRSRVIGVAIGGEIKEAA